jgi:hypothetical protein
MVSAVQIALLNRFKNNVTVLYFCVSVMFQFLCGHIESVLDLHEIEDEVP